MTGGLAASRLRPRGDLANTTRDAAFLCLHSVHPDGPPFLSIPPDLFERQLHTLVRRGWRAGTPDDLVGLLRRERPARPAAFLTFDDGYADNYERAWPAMRSFGMTGLVFLVPPLVGEPELRWPGLQEDAHRYPEAMRPMTWAMAEEMAAGGMAFGSHTLTHRRLTALGDEELRQELLDSRRRIIARLGRCDTIAYPFGEADLRVALAAVAAGYTAGFTVGQAQGVGTTAMTIPRIAVDHRDDERRLARKLHPAARRILVSGRIRALRSRLRGA